MDERNQTWDGKPLAQDSPRGVTVVVYRRSQNQAYFLLLHRAAFKTDYAGDWAWTPPAGGRLPGENPAKCASRELLEETALRLKPVYTQLGNEDWFIYIAEAPNNAVVQLGDPEYDRSCWVSFGEAVSLCKPALVADQIKAVAEFLGLEKKDNSIDKETNL